MSARRIRAMVTALALAAAVCACQGTPVRFQTSEAAGRPTLPLLLQAKACGFQLLLFIPIAVNDRQARAYQAVQAQAFGRPLVDVQIKEEWTYAFVGTQYCTTVMAKAAAS